MGFLILLFLTEIVLLIISYYITERDIMRPINIMLAVFCLSTLVTLLNGTNWNINYSGKAYFILTSGFVISLIADYFAFIKSKHYKNDAEIARPIKKISVEKWKLIFIIAVEVVTLFLFYKEIKRLAYLDGYIPGSNLLWHFRNITSYTAEESISGIVSLLTKFMDAVAYVMTFLLINNYLSEKFKKHDFVLYLIPVVLFAIKVLMSSGRQELLRWASFAIITSYMLYKFKVGWKKNITSRYVGKAIILVPIALCLFFYSSNIIGRSTSRTMTQYLSTYVGGSIQHFNQYISDPTTTTHFGEETFPGVYSFLKRFGITNYTRAVHLEMRRLGITQGNVYTFFRRPYNDFGFIGMLLFTFIVIYLFSNAYSSFQYKKDSYRNDYSLIVYAYLIYWIVLSSIEQYSIGIISIGTVMILVFMRLIYYFLVQFQVKSGKIIIYKEKGIKE